MPSTSARVDGRRDVGPVERALQRDLVVPALGDEIAACTWPFIVAPKVPRKLPSAVKNASITFLRSVAVGHAAP